MKENDYFLNYILNPTFSSDDFISVGLNADNTSIENKEIYKNLQFVQENPLLLTDGKFDEHKFDVAYNNALYGWNLLTDDSTNKSIVELALFFRDDIFAPISTRRLGPEFIIHRELNPDRQKKSFLSFNLQSAPQWSMREIGETQKVWDDKTQQWLDAPNDSFFGHFFETRVLALWDEDGTHIDPITGEEVAHKKGDKKLNANGTYYYENLGNKDIYGREVLSKWDTLTRDGSFANKFDFFDSDDLDKSFSGNLAKNVVKILPAFAGMAGIPFVAPIYLGLRVGLNFFELMPKVGKMFVGSDSPVLSQIEGFAKSFDLSSSDYSQQHAWALENIINLSADVFTLLAEQRWLFEYAPSLLRGDKLGFSKEAREAWMKDFAQKETKSMYDNLTAAAASGRLTQEQLIKKSLEIQTVSQLRALTALENALQGRTKFGEYLSKAYMTAVTVGDSYGEAKLLGLSDAEAAIFTLGYAAGEWGILNTGIGEWILPELRLDKAKFRQIANTLANAERPKATSPQIDKIKWYKKLFDTAKNFYEANYSIAGTASKHLVANALGEGIEEVSEELLADFSKSLFNASAWLRNDDSRLDAWDNIETRYGLSFIGGTIGGGLGQALPSYQEARRLKNLDKTGAFQEMVHIVKEGKAALFLAEADKMHLGDKLKSAKRDVVFSEDGTANYAPYLNDGIDINWDLAIKNTLRQQVKFVQDVLQANGAMVTDEQFLDEMTLKTLRFAELQNSSIAASYLLDFNTLASKIVDISKQIHDIEHPVGETDKKVELTEEDANKLSDLKSKLNKLIKQKDAYLDGTMAKEFIADALFEMTEDLAGAYVPTNFIRYAEASENKKIEDIDNPKLEQLKKEWDAISESSKADRIRFARKIFTYINERVSKSIANHDINYFLNSDFVRDLDSFFIHAEDRVNPAARAAIEQTIIAQAGVSEDSAILKTLQDIYSLGDSINPIVSKDFLFATLFLSTIPSAEPQVKKLLNISTLPSLLNTVIDTETGEKTLGLLDALSAADFLEFLKESGVKDPSELTSDKIEHTKKKLIENLISDEINNHMTELVELIKNLKYINRPTREFIQSTVTKAFNRILSLDKFLLIEVDEDIREEYELLELDIIAKEQLLNKTINTIPYSPIATLADLFLVASNNKSRKVSELLAYLESLMQAQVKNKDISEFGYSTEIEQEIEQALEILKFLKSHIQAARHDGASFTNIFGYNTTMNEINPDAEKLAEIDVNTANVILLDIDKLETSLSYYKTIFEINSGSKLSEHKKIGTQLWIKTFDKIKAIFYVPDELGKDEESENLKKAILEATISESLLTSDSFDLSAEQEANLLREQQEVEEALQKFLIKNLDKLSNFINAKNFKNLVSNNSKIISKNTIDGILDSDFIWYLATITAINSKKFYKAYQNAITDTFAPVPGQEQAIKKAFAFIANLPIFDKFTEAYNATVKEILEAATESQIKEWNDQGLTVSKLYPLNSDAAVISRNHFLVEGIPGAGKSTGFYATLINLINNVNPALLNKLWIVHLTKEDADRMLAEIAKAVKVENLDKKVTTLGKEDYLLKISNNKWTLKINEDGSLEVNLDDLNHDETTDLRTYKFEIDKSIDKPTLVFFDEFTHFSQLDLLFSDKFLNENNLIGIVTGDFDQSGIIGTAKRADGGIEEFRLHRNNFPHALKMGLPMRTTSKIKGTNIEIVRLSLQELLNYCISTDKSIGKPNIQLFYTLTPEGLFGDKVVGTSTIPEEEILLMLDTLLENETITFLYRRKDSELYKYIENLNNSGKYKGKFTLIKGTAQSKEGLYFIAETPNGNKPGDAFDFYTLISRAKQATLLIGNFNEVLSSVRTQNPGKVRLGKEAIKKFGETRKEIINKSQEGWTVEDFNPEKDFGFKPVKKEEGPGGSSKGEEGTGGGTSGVDEDNSEDEGIDNKRKTDELNKPNPIDIKNEDPSKYVSMLHTFQMTETGFDKNKSTGDLTKGYHADERIDSLNGLLKLGKVKVDASGKLLNKESAMELLAKLHSAIIYGNQTDNYLEDLKKVYATTLGLKESDISLHFAFKNVMWQKGDTYYDGDYAQFGYYEDEEIENTYIEGEAKKPRVKKFVLLVHDKNDKPILEIPFATLTNPISMMHTQGFEEILDLFEKNGNDLEVLLDELKRNPTVKNSKGFILALTIYLENYNKIVYLKNFKPLDFKITGIQPVTTDKGGAYVFSEEYFWQKTWLPIEELKIPGRTISQQVYTVTLDYPGYKFKKGHSFILVTDDFRFRGMDDQRLLTYYLDKDINPDEKRIKLIYVSAPVVDLRDYFVNAAKAFDKKRKANKDEEDSNEGYDPDLGNLFTSLRILLTCMNPNSRMGKRIQDYFAAQDPSSPLEQSTKKLWESTIKLINLIESKDTQEEKVQFLKSALKDTEGAGIFEGNKYNKTQVRYILLNMVGKFIMSAKPSLAFKKEKHSYNVPPKVTSDPFEVIINLNLDAIILDLQDPNVMKAPWKEGILYRIPLKLATETNSSVNVGGVTFVVNKVNNYKVTSHNGDLPLYANCKLDSAAFVFDLMSVLLEIVDGFDNLGVFIAKYTGQYDAELNEANNKIGWKATDKFIIDNGITKTPCLYFGVRRNASTKSLMARYKDLTTNKVIEEKVEDFIANKTKGTYVKLADGSDDFDTIILSSHYDLSDLEARQKLREIYNRDPKAFNVLKALSEAGYVTFPPVVDTTRRTIESGKIIKLSLTSKEKLLQQGDYIFILEQTGTPNTFELTRVYRKDASDYSLTKDSFKSVESQLDALPALLGASISNLEDIKKSLKEKPTPEGGEKPTYTAETIWNELQRIDLLNAIFDCFGIDTSGVLPEKASAFWYYTSFFEEKDRVLAKENLLKFIDGFEGGQATKEKLEELMPYIENIFLNNSENPIEDESSCRIGRKDSETPRAGTDIPFDDSWRGPSSEEPPF